MGTNEAKPRRRVTEEDALCCICRRVDEPLDLTKACIVWRNGAVAHITCYNAGRLAPKGRPPAQTSLEAGGAL